MAQSDVSKRGRTADLFPQPRVQRSATAPTVTDFFFRERGQSNFYPDMLALFSYPRSIGGSKRESLIRSFIQFQLKFHTLNRRVRDGIAQLPWVKHPETVEGHTGAGAFMIMHLRVFGILRLTLAETLYTALMIHLHEIDEVESGDVTLWTLEEKLNRQGQGYLTLAQWQTRRFNEYFSNGGKLRVKTFLTQTSTNEKGQIDSWGAFVQQLNDEFAEGKTKYARIAQQIDVLQAVLEAASRAYGQQADKRKYKGRVVGPWWNYDDYYQQAQRLVYYPLFTDVLLILNEEMEKSRGRPVA